MDVTRPTELVGEAAEHRGGHGPTAPPHPWSRWRAGCVVAGHQGRARTGAVAAAARRVEGVPR